MAFLSVVVYYRNNTGLVCHEPPERRKQCRAVPRKVLSVKIQRHTIVIEIRKVLM